MRNTKLENITDLCQHILRMAEVVTQKCGNRHRNFDRAFWELDRVAYTCLLLGYNEGYAIAIHYKKAARSQESIER